MIRLIFFLVDPDVFQRGLGGEPSQFLRGAGEEQGILSGRTYIDLEEGGELLDALLQGFKELLQPDAVETKAFGGKLEQLRYEGDIERGQLELANRSGEMQAKGLFRNRRARGCAKADGEIEWPRSSPPAGPSGAAT